AIEPFEADVSDEEIRGDRFEHLSRLQEGVERRHQVAILRQQRLEKAQRAWIGIDQNDKRGHVRFLDSAELEFCGRFRGSARGSPGSLGEKTLRKTSAACSVSVPAN